MAQINTFNNQPGAIFKDNSVTINAQQNNTQFNTESRLASESAPEVSSNQTDKKFLKKIRLAGNIDKIDIIRVVNAMCELHFFTDEKGFISTKKDVFAVVGEVLGMDLSRFSNNLTGSIGTSSTNEDAATERTFDRLKKAALKFNEETMERRDRYK